MAENLAERIIRAESTTELKRLRNSIIEAMKNLPNAEEIVDRDYHILRDELEKRGVQL